MGIDAVESASWPATPALQALWVDELLHGASAVSHVVAGYLLDGPVDSAALRRAVGQVRSRHPALSGRVAGEASEASEARLIGCADPAGQLDVMTLTRATPGQREEAVAEFVRRPLALATGPLLRAGLFDFGPGSSLLVLMGHEGVLDRQAADLVRTEICAEYAMAAGEPPPAIAAASPHHRRPANAAGRAASVPESLSYWTDRLAGAPQESTWPPDRPRPGRPTRAAGRVSFRVSRRTATRLRRLAREAGAAPLVIPALALQVMLARIGAGNDGDVVIGTPSVPEIDGNGAGITGSRAGLAALRLDIDPDEVVAALLRRASARLRDDLAHARYPFPWLVQHLAGGRPVSRPPLAQVMLRLDERPPAALRLGGVTGTPVPLFTGRTRTDLALTLTQDRGGYAGSLDYAAELYDRPTATTVAATFTALLGEIVSRPDTPAGDLRLVRRPPARSVPPRARAVPPPAGAQRQGSACPAAHELFRRQARSTPAAAALRWDGGELSYAGLDQAAARMAARLRAACPPGSLVAVCARRSPALAVALLAVLRAGSGYLPLDPAYPRERLDFMLRDSGAPLLLCDNDLAGTVTLPPGVRQLTLADDPGDSPPGDAPPAVTVTPDSLCYVIYTSGSTGEPRGVEMPHGPLANLLDWQARASAAGPGWRTLQFAPFSFDVAFQELFSTWATGGTLVLIDDDTRRDPKLLLDYLVRQGVHRLFLPFVALQSLAESACGLRRFPRGLREVVTAGEQLLVTPAIREFFRETGASLENQYGPSETHVVTAERLTGAPEGWPDVPAIGTPVTGAVVEVLDSRGHRLPPGVPGELWVSGPVLARGYRRRPDSTAERFVTGPDGRRYRTGDIGRAGPDGRLYYLGRDDGQVKVRGHRVEVGEVEASLKALPGVADAVVTVGERGRGGRQLMAHCVLADGAGLTTRELREGLARRLPGYLVPASFAVVPAFPLLPSGKVDRRALASAPVPAADGAAAAVRPRDAIELQLCGIWREVLGVPSVGVHDDFFELGGDSFAGVRMIAAIRRLLGTEIALADLLSTSTVEALARAVRAGGTPIAASPLVQLQPGDGTTPVYAFHPLPGTVLRYAAFARALGSGQAVWGLQSVGLQPGEAPLRTVSEMAETYLRHMRGVHPGGPWHLVGYSMGGTVAVEVARRLRQAGEPVGLVGLFDTSAAFDLDAGTDYSTRILVRMGLKINIDIERLLALDPAARTSELLSRSIEAGTLPADYDADRLRRMLDMYQHNGTALAAHRVAPYDGRVVVFRAENGRPGPVTEAPDLGWGTLAGEVVVHEVPGDHYLMMEGAQVGALARLVAGYLRDVRPEVREPAEVSR